MSYRIATIATLLASINHAQAAEPGNPRANENIDEEIIVTAHPLSGGGLTQSSTVLSGQALQEALGSNIGATLANEASVHSAQFGAAVGRPVIRGLGGPRVRVMEDRIDTLDLSVTSADHAVTIEPFIADRIEVLKGANALLYGSGAIGGIVDVHTGRIPHRLPRESDGPFSGGVESRHDTNNNGTTTAVKLDGAFGQLAWHVDGTWKSGSDYEIPGFVESSALRAQEAAEGGEEEEEEEAEARGKLDGSEYDQESFAIGASYIADWGFVGIAVSHLESEYGLPGGHGHGHEEEHEEGEEEEEHGEEEEGTAMLDMEQTRVDLELAIEQEFGPFSGLNVRLGINDYEHQEFEPDGAPGTEFDNEAWELRTEFGIEFKDWTGAVGFQHNEREYSAIGEEAFTPPADTVESGVFVVAERLFNGVSVETGVRFGRTEQDPSGGSSEDFTTYAASIGALWPVAENLSLSVILDHSARAPVAEELFSNGPHLVTNAFEVGDPNLDEEVATGLATTLRYDNDRWRASATVYYTQFSDFIFEDATGEIEDELPVFQFRQDDATFWGVDAEVAFPLWTSESGYIDLNVGFDWVRAELDDGPGDRDLPRIPPRRGRVELAGALDAFRWKLGYASVGRQTRVAAEELRSDSYEDLYAYAGYRWTTGRGNLLAFVNGRNLTDDEQRYHTSFIKDNAPAPGRTVELGLRLSF